MSSVENKLLTGFAVACLFVAAVGSSNPVMAKSGQKKDRTLVVALQPRDQVPDPNFPGQTGQKAFGDIIVSWSIDIANGYKAPTNLIIRVGGSIFSGNYLGMEKHGNITTSYIQTDGAGRFKLQGDSSTKVSKSQMPAESTLINTRHHGT